jgi:hypothetical protein
LRHTRIESAQQVRELAQQLLGSGRLAVKTHRAAESARDAPRLNCRRCNCARAEERRATADAANRALRQRQRAAQVNAAEAFQRSRGSVCGRQRCCRGRLRPKWKPYRRSSDAVRRECEKLRSGKWMPVF